MRHHYLFVVTSEGIKTFHKRKGSEELEMVKVNGGQYYASPFDSFWTWWEKTSSFLAEEDEVDFCIITEESLDDALQPPPFTEVKESKWEIGQLNIVCQRVGLGAITSCKRIVCGKYRFQDQYVRIWLARIREPESTVKDELETVLKASGHPIRTKEDGAINEESRQKMLLEGDMAFYYRNKTKNYQRR